MEKYHKLVKANAVEVEEGFRYWVDKEGNIISSNTTHPDYVAKKKQKAIDRQRKAAQLIKQKADKKVKRKAQLLADLEAKKAKILSL